MSRIFMPTLIYLDDYSDEICPCEPTLEAWTEWLSKPARDWGRRKAAKDGDTFAAAAIDLYSDIVATLGSDGKWSFNVTAPEDANHFAVRYGPGLGWDADSICGTFGDVIDYLIENEDNTDSEEHIVVGRWINDLVVTYHVDADGKASCTWRCKQ
jgi:hypothetical protein